MLILTAAWVGGLFIQTASADSGPMPQVSPVSAAVAGIPVISTSLNPAACSTSPVPATAAFIADPVSQFSTSNPSTPGALANQVGHSVQPSGNKADDVETAEASLSLPPDQAVANQGGSLWPILRKGFSLKIPDLRPVKQQIRWYQHHPKYLTRTFTRADRYLYYVYQQLKARHIPTEIALLPVVESAYHPFAYSNGRASGLWQFIPGTGRRFGLKQNWWYDGRRDVINSTRAALDYLSSLHDMFGGDWLLALAAYNSGAGTVQWAIRKNLRRHRPTDFWHLDLPRETRDYVPKLLAVSAIVADPSAYGVALPAVANAPQFAVVKTGGQIDLALAAKLADVNLRELYWLNPGCNRWSTAPNGPNRLLVPIDKAKEFKEKLAELGPGKRVHWVRHKIHRGDALLAIARHYRTTVALLRKVNHLRGNNIRAGHYLMIPVASRSLNKYALSATQRMRRAYPRYAGSGRHFRVTVHSGDSLWGIARRYGVSTRQLARWNGMSRRSTLHPGRKLVVWTRHHRTRRTVLAGGPPARIHRVHYTVRRGDSVAAISHRFKVRINDVLRWNGIHRNDYLQPGQRITLYVDVAQQSS